MNPLIIYTAKTAVYLTSFYIFYRIFLSRDTMHGRNRIFILLSVMAATIFPLISIHTNMPLNFPLFGKVLPGVFVTGSNTEDRMMSEASGIMSGFRCISIIYTIGLVLFLGKFAADLSELLILIRRKRNRGSNLIRLHGPDTAGFSAFGHIFVNDKLSLREETEIICHEQNHLNHHHSSDIVFLEFIKALQWFNPAIHLFERSLRAVHEYQADQECINKGTSVSNYQRILLNQIFSSRVFSISNSFSHPSLVKKRMIMMAKRPTCSLANLKLLIIIPVTTYVLLAFSTHSDQKALAEYTREEAFAYPPQPPPPPPTLTQEKVKGQGQIIPGEKPEPFVTVEQMPNFPGGEKALIEFLAENTKYPESAKKEGIQGKVFVRVVIDEEGKPEMESIIKGVSPDLDKEALRVVRTLPRFEPGRQSGKTVAVAYIIPINFLLE